MIMQTENRPLTAQEKIHRKFKIVAFECRCCGRSKLRKKVGPSITVCKTCSPGGDCKIIDRRVQSCANCGGVFSGRKKKYCSAKCRVQHFHSHGTVSPRRCIVCQTTFYHRTERTFCSVECKSRAWGKTCRDCGVSYTQKKNTSGKCRVCRGRDRNRASSIRLRVRRGKSQAAISKLSVREVWDRDNGVCQICRKRIDWNRKWPNSKSMSVDHIVPISKGGTDEEANVRAAHLGCNSKRGNKQGVQKRLF